MYNNQSQPETMRERYPKLPKEILALFEYGTVDLVLENIAREYTLNEEQRLSLRMELELTLYLFLPRNTLLERLDESLGIDREEIEMILSDLEENLLMVADPILVAAEKKFSTKTDSQEETARNALGSQAAETTSSQTVKPLRTFSDDAHNVHGYGSFKQDLEISDDTPVHRSEQNDVLDNRK